MNAIPALLAACRLGVHPGLLEAVVRVESGGDPLALALNGAVELVRAPRDRADAERMARWLATHGYNFDAGLAQVNSANFARLGLDARSVFEPCANLRAAAVVLEECDARARGAGLRGNAARAAALSCYNTGHLSRGIRNGYAGAVVAALRRSPAAGRPVSFPRPVVASFPDGARRVDVFALAPPEQSLRATERSPSSPQHP